MKNLSKTWSQRRLSTHIKLKLYKSLVIPVLLYASDTWSTTTYDFNCLQAFHMLCQRRILDIHWYDLISNAEIYSCTNLPPIIDLICSRRLSLFGHVVRLSNDVPAHAALILSSNIAGGFRPVGWSRPRGCPPKSWLQSVIDALDQSIEDIIAAASDRIIWTEVTKAACSYV